MISIRLKRMGSNRKPFYRVVVADQRRPATGKLLDTIGYYDPKREPAAVRLDLSLVDRWLKRGAIPSDTVRSLIGRARKQAQSSSVEPS
ncbi:MAG TPA: 30S ribosomal protein S16 [Acidobacteriota bacterium]